MKITVERVKEIIQEEHEKILKEDEEEGLEIMVRGYGGLGKDPKIALRSALRNINNFRKTFDIIEKLLSTTASGETDIDVEGIEYAIERLTPFKDDNDIELAIAKLTAVAEHMLRINEAKNEKKRS